MAFNFINIANFENRMTQQNIEIAFFNVTYGVKNCIIECAYSLNQRKFIFGFVNTTIGFTCTLNGIISNTVLAPNISTKLADCRDKSTKWIPSHFFDILNNQLPNISFAQITLPQYIGIYASASNFNDRIYFNHWRRSSMSSRQEQKTINLLGEEVVKFCHQNIIIPVFNVAPSGRTFDVAIDYEEDFNINQFN